MISNGESAGCLVAGGAGGMYGGVCSGGVVSDGVHGGYERCVCDMLCMMCVGGMAWVFMVGMSRYH